MSPDARLRLIDDIHAAPTRLVLAATGGGSLAISDLLCRPGASQTVIESMVPYSSSALSNLLGSRPEKACCPRTARAMAMASFLRAIEMNREQNGPTTDDEVLTRQLAGLGCTASLASDRPKRGAHRAHVAVQTATATRTASLELTKGKRTRGEEERLVADVLLNEIAAAGDIDRSLRLNLLDDERVELTVTKAPNQWQSLLLAKSRYVVLGSETEGDSSSTRAGQRRLIFPGAFNPLHKGHLRMAEIAASQLHVSVEYEISIENVDKPPLDYTEIADRVAQFSPDQTVLLTRAATFVEKADLFPGATFVLGADTLRRIADIRYYEGSPTARNAAIQKIVDQGCRFLVFGRSEGGDFQTVAELKLPPALTAICQQVEEGAFREDISSTEIRRRSQRSDRQ